MQTLYIFNPQSDLSLACNKVNYSPPPRARIIANDLSTLPIFYASNGAFILIADNQRREFANSICNELGIDVNIVETLKGVDIDSCSPWGWSLATVADLKRIGVNEQILPNSEAIAKIRYLSSRERCIAIITSLKDAGIDTPNVTPKFVEDIDDVISFILSYPQTVIKSPWSNSGKGVVWGLGRREQSVEQICSGFIKRQGGVLCEKFHNKVLDFAMEFYSAGGCVTFAGYSLFNTTKGIYTGNILTSNSNIESVLCRYVSPKVIEDIKLQLAITLANLIGVDYTGYLGVDMIIYEEGGKYRVNPCIEMNLRMNMGMAANIFYNRFVSKNSWGEFKIVYNADSETIYNRSLENRQRYPLKVVDGVIVSGYMPLTPILRDTNYLAEVIIYEGEFVCQDSM